MPRCAGIKRDGGQCAAIVNGSQTYCYQHDPPRADERRRNASKAARAKPSRELSEIKGKLTELADGVLEGVVERSTGAVVSQILNVLLRAVSVELKVKEVTELEERLEELERVLEQRQSSGRYGRGA
jgi:hypothetical protein